MATTALTPVLHILCYPCAGIRIKSASDFHYGGVPGHGSTDPLHQPHENLLICPYWPPLPQHHPFRISLCDDCHSRILVSLDSDPLLAEAGRLGM